MSIQARKLGRLALAALALAAGGCGAGDDGANLSVRAGDDPARLQKAQEEADQAARRAREAEAKKLRGTIKVEEP
jgi:hypothetical protein